MPSFTTTIQEYSPLLVYKGSWIPGASADTSLSSYNGAGFAVTQSNGDSVTFTFNGTGMQIFGAKRDNHGLYQATLDGNAAPTVSGASTTPIFQTSLYSTSSLQQGLHTVVLTNQEATFIDIDFVQWTTTIGNDDEELIVNTVDDTSPDFSYYPTSSAWITNPPNVDTFLGNTGHSTSVAGSSLVYKFQGDGVSLYGPVGPNYASYAVQVDGGPSSTFSATYQNFNPQTLLYHADGLGPGVHSLRLQYQPTQSGQIFAIDYAAVYGTPSLGTVALSALVGSSSPSKGLSGGQVAGIVFGLLFALGAIFGWLYYYFVIKRRYDESPSFKKLESSSSFAGLEGYSPNYVAKPGRAYSTRRRFQHEHDSFVMDQPISPALPPLPESTEDISEDSQSTASYNSQSHILASNSAILSRNSTSPRGNSGNYFSAKGRRPQLPASAGQSLERVSEADLTANRMVVEGRPQDFGAVSDPNNYLNLDERREINPPPDYLQATEPYEP